MQVNGFDQPYYERLPFSLKKEANKSHIGIEKKYRDRLLPRSDKKAFNTPKLRQKLGSIAYNSLLHQALFDAYKPPVLNYRLDGVSRKPPAILPQQATQDSKVVAFANKIKNMQPERMLDAPDIVDDFYNHPLDWKGDTVVTMLGNGIFLWNDKTGGVTEVAEYDEDERLNCVQLFEGDKYLAVGKDDGKIEVFDNARNRRIRSMNNIAPNLVIRQAYVGSPYLYVGDKVGGLSAFDVREPEARVWSVADAHSERLCGLALSNDGQKLISGGNDNIVKVWDVRVNGATPITTYTAHQAAVKAIALCPWKPNVVATAGGTADHTIRIWDINGGRTILQKDANSQVTNLNWNTEHFQLASTHGFRRNEIKVWQSNRQIQHLTHLGDITGHTGRIIGAAIRPDQKQLATISADETLRFWPIWDEPPKKTAEKQPDRANRLLVGRSIR